MDALRATELREGSFTTAQARDCHVDDKSIRRLLRAREWVRVRHGAYCFADSWDACDEAGQHHIRARAVMRSVGPRVALSHTSALIAHGLPVWGADLSRVHVTRLDGASGRVERDIVHHAGAMGPDEVHELDWYHVTEATRSLLESATRLPVEAGLVSADAALHRGVTDPDRLAARFRRFERWQGSQKVQLLVRLADGRAESPGESRARYLFWTQGLPAPELQFCVYDEWGRLAAVTDFAWPEHRLLGEFDGKVKYGRLLKPSEHPSDVVFAEKRREERVCNLTGFTMARLAWSDLSRPRETAERFRRKFSQVS